MDIPSSFLNYSPHTPVTSPSHFRSADHRKPHFQERGGQWLSQEGGGSNYPNASPPHEEGRAHFTLAQYPHEVGPVVVVEIMHF